MRDLKEVLEQNKEKYIEELKNLVGIDTHDLGHGIDGGLEKQGHGPALPPGLPRHRLLPHNSC